MHCTSALGTRRQRLKKEDLNSVVRMILSEETRFDLEISVLGVDALWTRPVQEHAAAAAHWAAGYAVLRRESQHDL